MWTREELKSNAKTVLRRYYWMAVVVCLIEGMISQFIIYLDNGIYIFKTMMDVLRSVQTGIYTPTAVENPIGFLWFLSIIFVIFVGNPLTVGLARYFMESRSQTSSIATLFYAFRNGRYLKVTKVMFIMYIKIMLWTLLFFIPGIIKSYEYYFIPYMLAENPNLETKRYFEISKAMTNDEKANMFVLDLSFVGWVLLGTLLCGVGLIFVIPYMQATYAEMYSLMRAKALYFQFASPHELIDFTPQQFS